ncbi:MAG TPA: UDP-2,3-diacylglucosamine diphosphatase, partial [Burkholderiales bacterium]|nr:UDP-2,3-diacylglucosamine diphosphatase [Burkholderiales bacterium]
MSTLFLSDLHLTASRPATVALFERFMAGPARQAAEVYILGDLFEYWAGDDDVDDALNRRVIAAMKNGSEHAPLFFMRGNRDFLAGERFAAASGATLVDDPLVKDLYGTPTLIMHGDTLCTGDTAYQAFRAQVRAPQWQRDFLAIPLAERRRQIEALRARSEAEKRVKPMDIMDVDQGAVEAAMRQSGCRRLIHGHTHRPAVHRFELDGAPAERWVLSDWDERGSYLVCDESGLRAEPMKIGA